MGFDRCLYTVLIWHALQLVIKAWARERSQSSWECVGLLESCKEAKISSAALPTRPVMKAVR